MAGARLPLEILHEIVLYSSASEAADLASLSFACRFFHAEVQPLLYHTIDAQALWPPRVYDYEKTERTAKSFTPTDLGIEEYTSRYLSFLRAVVNGPHLAILVRSFISCDDDRLDSSRIEFWPLLAEALSEMSNLKTIVFHHSNTAPPEYILEDCHPTLECFSWRCNTDRWNWDVSNQFLLQQTQLRLLHMDTGRTSHAPVEVADFLVPQLTAFIGTRHAIEAFCLDRPVTSLFWLSDWDEHDFVASFPRYVPLLNRLRTLEIETHRLNEYLLLMVSELATLERLSIIGTIPIEAHIVQISTLTHLKMSGAHSSFGRRPLFFDDAVRDDYVQSCFEGLPNLRIVDIEDFGKGFSRFLRGQLKSERIAKSIFEWCPVPYRWKPSSQEISLLDY